MEKAILDDIISLSRTSLRIRNREFKRYFLRDTPLTNRFSIVVGPRGVGKTTAMIQHLLECVGNDIYSGAAIYLQADHFLVARSSLYEIADEFYKLGGEFICFDEIHKYPGWSMELKSICDTFPNLKILASGSSAPEITKGSHDLSRRALVYRMSGMSFREYIGMNYCSHFDRLSLDGILASHPRSAGAVVETIEGKGLKMLALFKEYLEHGYYPYFREYPDKAQFHMALVQNIHTALEGDLPAIHQSLNGASIRKILKLLSIIASMVPFTPDMKQLETLLGIGDERTLKNYLKYLEDAGVIMTVSRTGKGLREMEKPEKIYLNNPNLCHALAGEKPPESGAMRETFFLNMLRVGHEVSAPAKGDFLVNDEVTFEVGGKNKDDSQIKSLKNAYLALDNIEVGRGNRIPLWLFGFLY